MQIAKFWHKLCKNLIKDSPLVGLVFRWDRAEVLAAASTLRAASPRHEALAYRLAEIADSPELEGLLGDLQRLQERGSTGNPIRPTGHYGLVAAFLVLLTLLGVWAAQDFRPPKDWLKTRLPGMVITKAVQGHGRLGLGVDADGKEVSVNGNIMSNAIGTHANSTIQLLLDNDKSRIRGKCAYPDRQKLAGVICRVFSNGNLVYESPPLSEGSRLAEFDVETGKQVSLEIRSTTDSINHAHGVWLDLVGY